MDTLCGYKDKAWGCFKADQRRNSPITTQTRQWGHGVHKCINFFVVHMSKANRYVCWPTGKQCSKQPYPEEFQEGRGSLTTRKPLFTKAFGKISGYTLSKDKVGLSHQSIGGNAHSLKPRVKASNYTTDLIATFTREEVHVVDIQLLQTQRTLLQRSILSILPWPIPILTTIWLTSDGGSSLDIIIAYYSCD